MFAAIGAPDVVVFSATPANISRFDVATGLTHLGSEVDCDWALAGGSRWALILSLTLSARSSLGPARTLRCDHSRRIRHPRSSLLAHAASLFSMHDTAASSSSNQSQSQLELSGGKAWHGLKSAPLVRLRDEQYRQLADVRWMPRASSLLSSFGCGCLP